MERMRNVDAGSLYFPDRLLKKLKLVSASQTVIIEAPSGYGKTTAVQGYFREFDAYADGAFWFTAVDEAPTALYLRLCREIAKIDSRAGDRLREIGFPNAFTIGETCDTLRSVRCSRRTWLVIDDFQFLFAALPPQLLAAMLDHGIDGFHIVMITRTMGQDFQSAIAGRGIPHITAHDLRWKAGDIRRYFSLSGEEISLAEAGEAEKITDGWIIAIHLQFCAYRETRAFSDEAIQLLMDQLIWSKMTCEQQDFLMRVSVFETCTPRRMCGLLRCSTLPGFAAECLGIPFIRYSSEQQRYEMHTIFLEMVRTKRLERGEVFNNGCLTDAGDLCRDEGKAAEAIDYYMQARDYGRILSLDLPVLLNSVIGETTFSEFALEVAQVCHALFKPEHAVSMLCVAWAVRLLENEAAFVSLMGELDESLPETGLLRAEWLLLSIYLSFPDLKKMLSSVQKAAAMFEGSCSRVIMPEAPWAFYEYLQFTAFHTKAGAADREADMLEEFIGIYSRLTGGHGNGADILFRAELAFLRCETGKAEIFAYKAAFLAESKRQKIIQTGAARLLASIAMLKADANGWQQALDSLEHAAAGTVQNTSLFSAVLDVVRSTLLAELRDYGRIAKWLQNADLHSRDMPASILKNAMAVHALYTLGQGDFARLIGFGEAVSHDGFTIFTEHIISLLIAVAFSSIGERAQAIEYVERSAKMVLPDGLIHYLAGFSRLLHGLTDRVIENSYPHLLAKFKGYKEQYIAGWNKLHNAIVADELPSGLTWREREIALLAADGLRNSEIAEKLYLSENTVRAHLRSVYQKLDIDRRAKLAEKLK